MNNRKHARRKLTHTQTIAFGFFLVILCGTLLLMLPISARDGNTTGFLDCLFTSTSATCVTGLVTVDTFQHWSLFGQIVVLILIQIGGMGFMTIGVVFAILLRRKITLNERGILQESMNVVKLGGIVRLAKRTAGRVAIVETAGALLLSIRFIPQFGLVRGIYYSVFHAVSAFCNAGIDLMGYSGAYSSFIQYSDDILVNVTIMSLIVMGGIGFVVWNDVLEHKWHVRRYMLHSKIVISFTLVLIVGASVLFYLLERNNLMKDMSASETVLTSAFSSVTARTAGFNTIDTAGLSNGSKLLTALLMFIGGSPGSTAGGIKTVTLVVLMVYVWSNIRNRGGCNIYRRRLDDEAVKNASNVLCISLFLNVAALIAICGLQPELSVGDVVFEVFSAMGTAGMSTGITRSLCTGSRVIIILLMYCGRLGSMTFAVTFAKSKKTSPLRLPAEKIMIG